MIKSLVRVKEVVGETAKQLNLSQKEVLRMASDQERCECDPALIDHLVKSVFISFLSRIINCQVRLKLIFRII